MKLYNVLSHKKELFKPLKGRQVKMYACGPTVYDFVHIGNLRSYIFEDVLRRILEYTNYKVKHVMNITDVDDKIIRGALKQLNLEARKPLKLQSLHAFTKPYEKAFFEDLKHLNIKPAFKYPRATEHIKEMTALIQKLLKKGLAYEEAGSIYFDISKFKKYGRLSRIKPLSSEALKFSSRPRIDVDEYAKDDIQDFVLWKAKKPGEPSWFAPFGEGRPGWHIECSAMSMKYLGSTFDIHTGAVDLIFPHHENEIAQSEGATGKSFVRFFIEGEHLLVDRKKMSKSLNNMFTLKDIEKRGFNPLAFRYLVLGAHYRSKLNFTWKSLESAQSALDRIHERVIFLQESKRKNQTLFRKEFAKRIEDDLDTPGGLAVFWKYFNSLSLDDMFWADQILGLNLETVKPLDIPSKVLKLVRVREKARDVKDWASADQIREQIKKLGWQIKDTAKGPIPKPLK